MTDLWSFTDNFSSIRDEYWSNKNDPRVCDMWMDWDSEWDHGADWEVLPVFVSEEIVNTRYGDAASWSGPSPVRGGEGKDPRFVMSNTPIVLFQRSVML